MFSDPEIYAKNFIENAALDKAQFEFETDDNLEAILAMSTYNNLVAKNQEDTVKNIGQAGGANTPSILQKGQIKEKLTAVPGFIEKASRNINSGQLLWRTYTDGIDKAINEIKGEIGGKIAGNIKTRMYPPELPLLEYAEPPAENTDPYTNYIHPKNDEWSPIKLFNEIASDNPYYGTDTKFYDELISIIGGKLDKEKLKNLFPIEDEEGARNNYRELSPELKNNIKIWTEYINSGFARFKSEMTYYIETIAVTFREEIKTQPLEIIVEKFEENILSRYQVLSDLWRKEATECVARTLSRSNTFSIRSFRESAKNIHAGAEGKVRFIEHQIMICLTRTRDLSISSSEVLNLCFNCIVHHRLWKGLTNIDLLTILQRVIRRTIVYFNENKAAAAAIEQELLESPPPVLEIPLTAAQKKKATAAAAAA